MMEIILQGIAAADGYAGGALFFFQPQVAVDINNSSFQSVSAEIDAFKRGRECYLEHLHRLITAAKEQGDATTVDILDAYTEILTDDEMEKEILAEIKKEGVAAIVAVDQVFRAAEWEMLKIESNYARQRSEDIRQIGQALLRAIAGGEWNVEVEFPSTGFILCGSELTPMDTAGIPKERLLGIISETGGKTSHIALLAQNLAIPAVVGVKGLLENQNDVAAGSRKQQALLDGCEGIVVVNPLQQTIETFAEKQTTYQTKTLQLETLRDVSAQTVDGTTIQLLANIGSLEDIDAVEKFGAEGIGLFRTEFLFASSTAMPDEETQFTYYRQLVSAMRGKPVTIRTLDTGGDKPLPYLPFPKEQNPFLGWRGCRIYQAFPELILTQLRAILRTSLYGNVRIMIPMISSVEEVQEMLGWVHEAQSQLSQRNIAFKQIPLGIMIETPAAVLLIEELLTLVDFCSIGSNDLTQYILAVDRGNEKVSSLYNPFHPAVLRAIAQTVRMAKQQGKSVSLCGELGGEPLAAPFLVGIGLNQLSMSPSRIPALKQQIRQLNLQHSQDCAQEFLLHCKTAFA